MLSGWFGNRVFDKPEQIKEWVDFRPVITVNEENHALYNKYYKIFRDLYENTKNIMKELVEI